ncbi:uncharacterized protein BX663DRAFT_548041 [Cokeromyces recurvatus]|uniref:uncharacterized protein n=1 Tax=Cokeromyces recurvatus TaxID=90255 RepID=UPI00221E80FE|nr:uncharacterized protein BX663DRAFT_548041 [Cokeromyces recurvatus]KAI7906941.1 hypothetical protein BX663DRAFT_548041 [Cokeromyces recurvatus]
MADTFLDDSAGYLVSDENEKNNIPPESMSDDIKNESQSVIETTSEVIDIPKEKQDDYDSNLQVIATIAEALNNAALKYNTLNTGKYLEFVPDPAGLNCDAFSDRQKVSILNKIVIHGPKTPPGDDSSLIPVMNVFTKVFSEPIPQESASLKGITHKLAKLHAIDYDHFKDHTKSHKDLKDVLKVNIQTPEDISLSAGQAARHKVESYFAYESDDFSPKQITTFDDDPPSPPSPSRLKKVTAHYERRRESKDEEEEETVQNSFDNNDDNDDDVVLSSLIEQKDPSRPLSLASADTMLTVGQKTLQNEQREPDVLPSPSIMSSHRSMVQTIRNLNLDDLYLVVSRKLYKEYVNGNQHAICLPMEIKEQPDFPLDFESLSSEEKRIIKQMSSLHELIMTEKSYSSNLSMLCTYFFQEIYKMADITKEQRMNIVCNALDIASFHIKFTNALLLAHDGDKNQQNTIPYSTKLKSVLLSFIEWAPKLDIYHDYCVKYDYAVSAFSCLLQSNPKFKEEMDSIFHFHSESLGLSKLKFQDYFAIPFQRIFKYEVLLQTIENSTLKDTEEYLLLLEAQKIIHAIVKKIDIAKSVMETNRKSKLFLSRLVPEYHMDKRWFESLGSCLLIGTLIVRPNIESKTSDRVGCALFKDYMIITEAKKREQYIPKHWFSLFEFNLVDLPNDKDFLFYPWRLENSQHILEFCAICESEKKVWIEKLDKAIKDSKEKDSVNQSSDTKQHELEHVFISSFELMAQRKHKKEKYRSHSTSFTSQTSSFLDSVVNQNKYLSRSSFSPLSFHKIKPDNSYTSLHSLTSSMKRPLSVASDMASYSRPNFNVENYQARCKVVDMKFKDVCTTPIMKARARSSFYHYDKKRRSIFDNYRYSASALFSNRPSLEIPNISSLSIHKVRSPRMPFNKAKRNSTIPHGPLKLHHQSEEPMERHSSLAYHVNLLRSSRRNTPNPTNTIDSSERSPTFLEKMAQKINLKKPSKGIKTQLKLSPPPSKILTSNNSSLMSESLNTGDYEISSKSVKKKLFFHLYPSSRQLKK